MKKSNYILTILMSIFIVFISCSDEETSTGSEINSNSEILDFSFLTNPNPSFDSERKIENSEIIYEFLNNYERVLQKTPVDHYISDLTDNNDVNSGMTDLILSDEKLNRSFVQLQKNGITIKDIKDNFENWNSLEKFICIPNIDACRRSASVCNECPSCAACCAACLGAAIHCCSNDDGPGDE